MSISAKIVPHKHDKPLLFGVYRRIAGPVKGRLYLGVMQVDGEGVHLHSLTEAGYWSRNNGFGASGGEAFEYLGQLEVKENS